MIIEDKEFVLYLESNKIRDEVKRMASEINRDLAGIETVFLVVLNGAFMFAADLLRHMNLPLKISFIRVSSYEGMKSSGKVLIQSGPEDALEKKTVVIVEDILDSGLTLQTLLDRLKAWNVHRVRIAALFFKHEAYRLNMQPDYTGFHIPNRFVVGYGLDYKGFGRNLPDLYMYREG